ncbi:hypothetical protein AZF37_07900 [endosymbiont 'TC1' of Trimyema compressum]|uniref:4-(cytidine 5'-diphospho)-2-C-methyl-D-erythritol kinase n=1 Tax=endosymbiont 'TC1' of Trimyema compressum TaxID=243899 RepID=UPI0007F14059|nr:4-(cytidine 5'-diphospho)-2-C-methyl-D-erythritol kinase [endosymbiont 'TC1' of Trimyema compressum]AMP21094.1 hypothetical protein AZF37_07900 [endosymbiont 'TC1' of Trimyema compressum]
MKIVKKAYGKINLTLEVEPLNNRGLHPLNSIMQSIALHDTLTFESRSDLNIALSGNRDDLSYGEDNLIVKAAKLLRAVTGVMRGVTITLNKGIPIAAGLGGGSSDAATTLLALNCLWDVDWPIGKLVTLGSRIGSDVPFCIIGGTCFVEGTGEKVRPIPSLPKTSLLVIKSDFGVSTKTVYDEFDRMGENYLNKGYSEKMEVAITKGIDYRQYLTNDLEKATRALYPEINSWIQDVKESCETVLMSGSGPTLLAFAENDFIKKAYNEIKNKIKFAYITNTL